MSDRHCKYAELIIRGITNYSLEEHERDCDTCQADKEIERLTAVKYAAVMLDPYFDQLICYASTPAEHEPNRLIRDLRKALAAVDKVSTDETGTPTEFVDVDESALSTEESE